MFFALGTLLMLISHEALVAEDESYTVELAKAPALRDRSIQDLPRDRAA